MLHHFLETGMNIHPPTCVIHGVSSQPHKTRSWMRTAFPTLLLLTTLGAAAFAPMEANAQIAERYDNPYIDDGTLKQSPFEWKYEVVETRMIVDDYGKPWLHQYINEDPDKVVNELKRAYRTRKPIAPSVYVKGFVFLTMQQVWSFTIGKLGSNVQWNVWVIPNKEGRGCALALLARQRRTQSAVYKRAWFGFSPVGLEPYSTFIRAY